MRVECEPDAIDFRAQVLRRSPPLEHRLHGVEVARLEHRALRKNELKNRVFRNARPIDQVVQDVLIGSERQHLSHDLDRLAHVLVEPRPLRHRVNAAEVNGAIALRVL